MNEQRVVNVLLNNESAFLPISSPSTWYQPFYFSQVFRHIDSLPSIGILSRFYDPRIKWTSIFLSNTFDGFIFICFYEIGFVFTLRFINNILLLLIDTFYDFLLFELLVSFYFIFTNSITLLDLLGNPMIMLFKLGKLKVTCMLGKIGYGQNWKRVNTTSCIVLSHVNEKPLFVCKLFVIVHSTIYLNGLVDIHVPFFLQVINVFISLPWSPYKVSIYKFFVCGGCPPVSMFYYLFYNLVVVPIANCKFLVKLQQLFLFLQLLPLFNQLFFYFDSVLFLHWIKLFFLPPVLFLFYFFINKFLQVFVFLLLL